jgi:hypothetical protein
MWGVERPLIVCNPVLRLFGDVYNYRVSYRRWCELMAKSIGPSCTYQHIYLEAAAWLTVDIFAEWTE